MVLIIKNYRKGAVYNNQYLELELFLSHLASYFVDLGDILSFQIFLELKKNVLDESEISKQFD